MSTKINAGPKIGFFGPMKPLDSADHSLELLPSGHLRARIRHEAMRGVSSKMLRWWFENLDASTRFNGMDFSGPPVPVYRYWHPFDHIRFSWARRVHDASGRLAPGSVVQIEENLGGRFPVRSRARVTKFDDTAFNFDLLAGGQLKAGHLLHEYAEVEGGCSFYTEMLLGVGYPVVGRLLNAFFRLHVANEEFVRTWIVHNIEESGETEKFVPKLYRHAMEVRDAA